MKKMLSIILVLSMILSCAVPAFAATSDAATEGGFSFSLTDLVANEDSINAFKDAINNYNPENMPVPDSADINELLNSGALDNCNMMGISIDFLYNSTKEFAWGSLYELDKNGNIIFYDENGVQVPQSEGGQPKLAVSKGDLSLANANLNMYLRRIVNKLYAGVDLYTAENATKLTNIIGGLFYPDYNNQVITFSGTQSISEDDFYKTVVEKSGLGALIQTNWCDTVPAINFKPFLTLFGLSLSDVLDSEYKNGYILAEKLLKATVQKFISGGPINYILDFVWAFSRAYTSALYEPTKALFTLKINAGYIDYEEMKTFDGLINLIANNNNPNDTTKLQFIDTPTRRFGMAKDTNELFLYLLVYFNLNCRYKNNTEVVRQFNGTVQNLPLGQDYKNNLINIVNNLLSGRIDNLVDVLGELYVKNVEDVPGDIWKSIKVTLAKFFQQIADFFDNWFKILTGQKDFGT